MHLSNFGTFIMSCVANSYVPNDSFCVPHQKVALYVEVFDFQGVFLDELAAGFDVVTHQDAEAEIRDNEFVDSGQQVCRK
jgi:hypothetical protein